MWMKSHLHHILQRKKPGTIEAKNGVIGKSERKVMVAVREKRRQDEPVKRSCGRMEYGENRGRTRGSGAR